MTKQCKYILNCCKKLNEPDFHHSSKDGYIRNVHKLDGGIQIKKYSNEASSAFDYLCENGYLKKTQFGYTLTQKGLHPNRMIWEEIRNFLIKSVIIPIVVSSITTLVTLWITSLLQQLQSP